MFSNGQFVLKFEKKNHYQFSWHLLILVLEVKQKNLGMTKMDIVQLLTANEAHTLNFKFVINIV